MEIKQTVHSKRLARAFRKAPEAMTAAISAKINTATHYVARSAKQHAPKAFSQLTKSIIPTMVSRLEGRVTAGSDYAVAVEEGTEGGGAPTIKTLMDWIKVKGITPNNPDDTQEDLAYLIQRHIVQHGTQAQPFMQPAFEDNRQRIMRLLNQGASNGLKAAGL